MSLANIWDIVTKIIDIIQIQIKADGVNNPITGTGHKVPLSTNKTVYLNFVGQIYNSDNFDTAPISNRWCFDETNNEEFSYTDGILDNFKITSDNNNFSATLRRRATTGDHRVNAVISYKNSEIAKVWFTALY